MNTAKVVSLNARPQKNLSDLMDDLSMKVQADAIQADYDQQANMINAVQQAYANLRFEKAKFFVAFLNPVFFQKCLESLEGAKLAIVNYWAMGDGLFFYRHVLGCQIGKYSQDILFNDELTEGQIIHIAMKLQASVKWAETELQGARVK